MGTRLGYCIIVLESDPYLHPERSRMNIGWSSAPPLLDSDEDRGEESTPGCWLIRLGETLQETRLAQTSTTVALFGGRRPASSATLVSLSQLPRRLFNFYIFQKKNYRNIFLVLDFTFLYPYFYISIPLLPVRGAAGGLPPDRGAVGTYM